MFLLDTNVVSELRKAKAGRADKGVSLWAAGIPVGALFLSVITVLELETGVLLMERRDAVQGAVLRAWLDGHVSPVFAGRILAIDTLIAQRCARLLVPNQRAQRDALIAATAIEHRLTLITRNVRDFAPTGVALLNPWESNT